MYLTMSFRSIDTTNYFLLTLGAILTFPFLLMPKGSSLRNYLHSGEQQISPHNLTALLSIILTIVLVCIFFLWSVCCIVKLIYLFFIIFSACLDAHIFSLSVKIR